MSVLTEWEMCCPNCKRDTHLQVEMTCWAKLEEGGTNTDVDHEWNDASGCLYTAEGCDWTGDVYDATKAAETIRDEQQAEAPDETA